MAWGKAVYWRWGAFYEYWNQCNNIRTSKSNAHWFTNILRQQNLNQGVERKRGGGENGSLWVVFVGGGSTHSGPDGPSLLSDQPVRSVSFLRGGYIELPPKSLSPDAELLATFATRNSSGIILAALSQGGEKPGDRQAHGVSDPEALKPGALGRSDFRKHWVEDDLVLRCILAVCLVVYGGAYLLRKRVHCWMWFPSWISGVFVLQSPSSSSSHWGKRYLGLPRFLIA